MSSLVERLERDTLDISDEDLRIIIEIKKSDEIDLLKAIIENHSTTVLLINKIQTLKFDIYIGSPSAINKTQELLTAIEQNLHSLHNLIDLNLRDVQYIPNFPVLNKLKNLTIQGTGQQAKLNLFNSLSNLRTFNMGWISGDLCLSNTMKNLTHLVIQGVGTSCNFQIFPNNLSSLSIGGGTLTDPSSLNVSGSLANLKHLLIGVTNQCCTTKLPDALLELRKLEIGSIHENGTVKLPALLNNLTDLVLYDVHDQSNFKLPATLPNLKSLTLWFLKDVIIEKLPDSLPQVTELIIRKFGKPTTNLFGKRKIHLPISFNCLESLVIPGFDYDNEFHFVISGSMNNLKTLHLNYMSRSKITLPDSLPNLTKLYISSFKNENVELPNSLPNLIELIIDEIDSNIKLPRSIPNLSNLVISKTVGNSNIKLSESMPNLTSLTLGKTTRAIIQLPRALNKLTTLSMEEFNFDLPDSLPNLENLIIKNQHATLTSVDGHKEFTIGGPSYSYRLDNSTANFLYAINKLINLPPSPEVENCCCQ